jgi:hypothetical protein
MSGAPPSLTDLKAFVDCCCNKGFGDTRRELDNRVGPLGILPIRDWMNATEYAHDRLLSVLRETRLLTRRAVEMNRTYQGEPVAVAIRRWQAQLFRATGNLQYVEESWLMGLNEMQLRHFLVGYVVARWVREDINGDLRIAIRNALIWRPELTGLSRMFNTDATQETIDLQ